MRHLLQEAFDVVAPALERTLVPEPIQRELRTGLGVLAPILQVGLEMRLGAGASQVDVQQAVLKSQGHHHIIARYAARVIAESDIEIAPAWKRIGALTQQWAAGGEYDWLDELWLEYDVTQPLVAQMVPSVFLSVPTDRPAGERRIALERATASLWRRLLPDALTSLLETCFESTPGGAWVSHVGMMLARPVDALRVNVKGLPPESADDFLRILGLEGSDVETRMQWLLQYAKHVTVALDIGRRVGPRIGLEAFFRGQPGEDGGWQGLLDDLVEEGACTSEKREALLAWSGVVAPSQTAVPWPGDLIARALMEPDRLSTMVRRLNHLKVTWQRDHPLEAKAYLGFGHTWASASSASNKASA